MTVRVAAGGAGKGAVPLMAVIADDVDRSSVLRGENSGRTLQHVAVARSLTQVGEVRGAGEQTMEVKLPAGFQAGTGHHLILFAQAAGLGRVEGIDTAVI